MNIYEYIRDFADTYKVKLEDSDVSRLASVLKTAGFKGELSQEDRKIANPILAKRVGRIVGASSNKVVVSQLRTADTEVAQVKDESTFKKIDALVKQGKCARCSKPTEKVRLSDYTEVFFCPECRTALW